MGKLWRWNGHRTRSGSRAPEHHLVWQLMAPTAPPGLGQADTVPRRLFRGACTYRLIALNLGWVDQNHPLNETACMNRSSRHLST